MPQKHCSSMMSAVLLGFCLIFFSLTAQAENILFDVSEYVVEGNTLLDKAYIQKGLTPYTGRKKNFGDVQQAVEWLEHQYRKAGYAAVFVQLPEQELDKGRIRINVVEARLEHVSVEGNQHFDGKNIRASLPALQEGKTPNTSMVSLALRLANENPTKKTDLIFKPGSTEGSIQAVAKVKDENPRRFFVTLDNSGDDATGQSRLGLGFQHANVANRDHVFTAQYITSPEKPDDVSIFGLGYHIPLYGLNDAIEAFAGYSDVSSGVVGNLFNVSGKGTILGLRYTQNFQRIGNHEPRLTYGIDYRAFQNSVIPLGGGGTSEVPDYTIRPVSITYSGKWTWPGVSADIYVSLAHNIPGADKGSSGDINAARTGADDNYTIYRYGVNFQRSLMSDWLLRLSLNGQWSKDALVPGEQFGIGGAYSVRGFNERELSNDAGHQASVELYGPEWAPMSSRSNLKIRPLAFLDFAHLRRNKLLPGEQEDASIGSTGIGLRIDLDNKFSIKADWGMVLDEGGSQQEGDSKLHASLSYLF